MSFVFVISLSAGYNFAGWMVVLIVEMGVMLSSWKWVGLVGECNSVADVVSSAVSWCVPPCSTMSTASTTILPRLLQMSQFTSFSTHQQIMT